MQTALQKEKELLKSNQQKVLREKTNQQTNSNAIEVMNNRVTDSVERGFKPSWVLEETAKHLALRTLETEDDKWLEMIHYLTTQGGPEGETSDLRRLGPNSYGKTLKGKRSLMLEVLNNGEADLEKATIVGMTNAGLDLVSNVFVIGKATKIAPKSLLTELFKGNIKKFLGSQAVKDISQASVVEFFTETTQEAVSITGVGAATNYYGNANETQKDY